MIRIVAGVAMTVAIGAGCRGRSDEVAQDRPKATAGSAVAAVVPVLPASPDGHQELVSLDRELELHRDDPRFASQTTNALLDRAAIRGDPEDFLAALDVSKRWVERAPDDLAAWKARATTLGRVHRFAAAREALDHGKRLTPDATEWDGIEATLDEATGQLAKSGAYREAQARRSPTSRNLTLWAADLALAGRYDDAIAQIPRAAAELRDPSPITIGWLYFQWGRIYEQRGHLAIARQFYEAAHARMPDALEYTVHLAQTTIATGGDARELIASALATNPHPELLALAGRVDEARTAWERYLSALPEAFSDHAARFFLGPGKSAPRALELAKANLANRDTLEARQLAVEAALAADAPEMACALVGALATGTRAHQVAAWKALSACGRTADAEKVAHALGIQ